jgi:hypothetical protein
MLAQLRSPLPRLTAIAPSGIFTERVLRRGGRCFEVDGTVVVTLREPGSDRVPDAEVAAVRTQGALHVLVPRGFGHPLLARSSSDGRTWRAEGTGEPCLPARWVDAGRVIAYVREAALPSRPVRAEPAAEAPVKADGPWLCVRWTELPLAAAQLADPSLRRGPVAVAGRWVVTASDSARARGVRRGMTRDRATRLCPDLRIVPCDTAVVPPEADGMARGVDALRDALVDVLQAELGPVRDMGLGRVCVRLPSAEAPASRALARAEQVLRRLYQAYGVRAAAVVAVDASQAAAFASLLPASRVAVLSGALPGVRPGASARWGLPRRSGRVARSTDHASWSGASFPDIDGSAALCGHLAVAIQARHLRFAARTERGPVRWTVAVPAGADAALRAAVAEAAGRRALAFAGPVQSVACRPCLAASGSRSVAASRGGARARASGVAASGPRQLALLPLFG